MKPNVAAKPYRGASALLAALILVAPPQAFSAEEMTAAEAMAEIERHGGRFSTVTPLPRTPEERAQFYARARNRSAAREERPPNRVELAGERVTDKDLALLKFVPTIEDVYISNSMVTDAGFKELYQLPRLTSISFYGRSPTRKLTDQCLLGIEKVQTLKELYFRDAAITERGCAEIAQLTRLEALSVAGNGVNDAAMAHLAHAVSLVDLALWETSVSDHGLFLLQMLPKLKRLVINSAGITDAGLESARRFPAIESFDVRSDKLSEHAIGRLKGWEALTTFGIGGVAINDTALADLAGLPNLQSLNISYNRGVSDTGLKHLKSLTKLEWLGLHHTSVTDAGMPDLAPLQKLTELNISSTAVTDAGLEALKPLKALRTLVVPDTVTKASIDRFHRETGVGFPGR